MSQLKSFFDDENIKGFKTIWTIPLKEQDKSLIKIKCTLINEFLEIDKKGGFTNCTLGLKDTTLYYIKKGNIKGHLDIQISVVEFIEHTVKKQSAMLGFSITRNQQQSQFFIKNQEEFMVWKNILNYKAIMNTFHQNYDVVKMIGRGSFAKVYQAYKKSDPEQLYAIKAFNKEFMYTQYKGQLQLINEIKIMKQFHTDKMVRLYEVYETENSVYFVMDNLSGGELLQQIKKNHTNFKKKDLYHIMQTLLMAIKYLHQKNIIHRDLKPENILLKDDQSWDVVIADFGLATRLDDSDILFKRCGTPGYVGPEVLLYDEIMPFYDSKCDIFSLGVIFYLLNSGVQPFQGEDYKEILRANKQCQIDFSILEKSNEQEVDLIVWMLQENPKKRPSSSNCLDHQYFQNPPLQSSHNLDDQFSKILYFDYEFKKKLQRCYGKDSQENILTDSFQLRGGIGGRSSNNMKYNNSIQYKQNQQSSLQDYNLEQLTSPLKLQLKNSKFKQANGEQNDYVDKCGQFQEIQVQTNKRKCDTQNLQRLAILNDIVQNQSLQQKVNKEDQSSNEEHQILEEASFKSSFNHFQIQKQFIKNAGRIQEDNINQVTNSDIISPSKDFDANKIGDFYNLEEHKTPVSIEEFKE